MPIIRKLSKHNTCTQITVPPEILKFLNVSKGEYLVWAIDQAKQVVIDKLTPKKYPGFFVPGTDISKYGR